MSNSIQTPLRVRPSGDDSNFFSTSGRGKDFKSSVATAFNLEGIGWPALGFIVGILWILAMFHVCELQQRLPENLHMPKNIDAASDGVVKREQTRSA